jgi:hypothetical protein
MTQLQIETRISELYEEWAEGIQGILEMVGDSVGESFAIYTFEGAKQIGELKIEKIKSELDYLKSLLPTIETGV